MTARTRPPESPELARARLRRGAGLDALAVLYSHGDRSMTTKQVTEQTHHEIRVIGAALGRARALGLVERRHVTGVEPRIRVWRITVTGCEFLRRTKGVQ